MSYYSRTDCSVFERQGNTSKQTRKQDRKERLPRKSVLSDTLLPCVTRVQSHWEILGNGARRGSNLSHLRGERAGVFIHQLLSALVKGCSRGC